MQCDHCIHQYCNYYSFSEGDILQLLGAVAIYNDTQLSGPKMYSGSIPICRDLVRNVFKTFAESIELWYPKVLSKPHYSNSSLEMGV